MARMVEARESGVRSEMPPMDPRAGFRMAGIGAGAIAFDYGDRTYRLADVDEAEAKRIVALLAQDGLGPRA